jgi:3',5'-cyclic AMP phosphodiesterase CpdA
MERRDFLTLATVSGIAFASGCTKALAPVPKRDFFFLQLSDTHVGYEGAANPDAARTLPRAVETIRASKARPDFIVFTGDLTQTTEDDADRHARMKHFKEVISGIDVPLHFIPGEHDASSDAGAAFREHFGETHWTFEHEGLHFIGLDNVSQPNATLGDAQLAWLDEKVSALPKDAPLVVFAHRPLFDLAPQWDWWTKDGARALEILSRHDPVTVFYGHIHQEHHRTTGRIAHHASRSLVFPLPAPMSVPKKAPLPWEEGAADHGLGYREVRPLPNIREMNIVVPK